MNVNNDIEILKNTRRDELPGGGIKLLFPGDLLPSGEPVVHMIKQADGSNFAEWCNIVRSAYSEGEDSAQAEDVGAEDAHPPAGGGESEEVRRHGGGDVAVPDSVQTSEEAMERTLRTTLAKVKDEIESLREQRTAIDARLDKCYVSSMRLQRAYDAYCEDNGWEATPGNLAYNDHEEEDDPHCNTD